MTTAAAQQEDKRGFEAEVSRLLHLMIHSVYSEREIFLRELISNASDACDKLRYAAIASPQLTQGAEEFAITITVDEEAKTLTIADNGIGMNHDDLISHLGTIARSGTSAFMEKLSGDDKKDVSLIGQFGVGFYSVFMVADKVTVTSRRAGEDQAWSWVSDGVSGYTVAPAVKERAGTDITLHLKDDAEEFLQSYRLQTVIKTYSDHIDLPITLVVRPKEGDESSERVNEGKALWGRPKSEVSDEQYKEFYHHVAHAMDDPWMTLHYRAEGVIEYSVLLFVPTERPHDLFDPARKNRVKLYVKRVFITDDCEDLLPGYLRFLRGVIDSQDLPLNISREMLQNNPVLSRMQKAVTNRILSELEKKAEKEPEAYQQFWDVFGSVLKEGIYEDFDRRDQLLKLARFKSSAEEGWSSLSDYVGRMGDEQNSIYYITGDSAQAVARSPQLEGYRARGIEVLYLTDPVDDFWLSMVPEFEGKALKSVTKGTADLSSDDEKDGDTEKKDEGSKHSPEIEAFINVLRQVLGDKVKDVKTSTRLVESAVCLVADENGMDMHLQRVLQQHQQATLPQSHILEINPGHPLILGLASKAMSENALTDLEDAGMLLFDQARIMEGEHPEDPIAFAQRLSALMLQASS
ncbi:MAG: molecular chaperone HtpG [Kordiimonas sp.]|nr:molecular chaperone HtpG [Kordiimonas sp.]|tara:strand:+ start:527 stop:2428 length:1902 start_codon:yes stop_codon:yes gene_type:complete